MNPISAALLAGGRSTRMGRDKCLLEIDGIPLWRRQFDLLAALSSDVMVVAPTRPAWVPPAARWIADATPDHGPLGGLVAALAGAAHGQVVVLAVDLPAMTAGYLASLRDRAGSADGVVPAIDRWFQPLSAVYPRDAHATAARHLTESDKSLQRLVRELVTDGRMKCIAVESADRPLFRNLNTAAD